MIQSIDVVLLLWNPKRQAPPNPLNSLMVPPHRKAGSKFSFSKTSADLLENIFQISSEIAFTIERLEPGFFKSLVSGLQIDWPASLV